MHSLRQMRNRVSQMSSSADEQLNPEYSFLFEFICTEVEHDVLNQCGSGA